MAGAWSRDSGWPSVFVGEGAGTTSRRRREGPAQVDCISRGSQVKQGRESLRPPSACGPGPPNRPERSGMGMENLDMLAQCSGQSNPRKLG